MIEEVVGKFTEATRINDASSMQCAHELMTKAIQSCPPSDDDSELVNKITATVLSEIMEGKKESPHTLSNENQHVYEKISSEINIKPVMPTEGNISHTVSDDIVMRPKLIEHRPGSPTEYRTDSKNVSDELAKIEETVTGNVKNVSKKVQTQRFPQLENPTTITQPRSTNRPPTNVNQVTQ